MKIRRLLVSLAATVMAAIALPMTVAAAGDDIQAVIGTASGYVGDTVSITFSVPKNTGFTSFDVGFTWDKEKVQLVGISPDPSTKEGRTLLESKGFPNNSMQPIWEFNPSTGTVINPDNPTPANRGSLLISLGSGDPQDGLYKRTATNLFIFKFKITDKAKPGEVITLKSYRNVAGPLDITQPDIPIKVTNGSITVAKPVCKHSQIKAVSAVAATCDKAGNTAYYVCGDCGEWFKDKAATSTITDHNSVKIAALGHSYGTPSYSWTGYSSCTATMVCSRNSAHKITENAAVTSKVTTDATCTSAGVTTYTAKFANSSFKTQTKTNTQAPAAKGHDWTGEPSYSWSADHSSCTATLKCKNCSETKSEKVTAQVKTTEAQGCKDGSNVYTAKFSDTKFGEQTYKETIKAPGNHIWGKASAPVWNGFTSCTVTHICTLCSTEETVSAAITKKVTKAATCTAAGSTTYTATFPSELGVDNQTKTDNASPKAAGHNYGAASYTYNENDKTYTATKVCQTDASHTVTETVSAKSKVTKAATCTAEGVTTYTWSFTKEGFKAQVKTEPIEKIEHTEAKRYENIEPGKSCEERRSAEEVVYCTVCKEVISRTPTVLDAQTHADGEAVRENEKEPTCTEAGGYDEVVYCTQCGLEISRTTKSIEALGHEEGEAVIENEKAATTEAEGSYDEVVYCTRCEEELSRETKTVPKLEGSSPDDPDDDSADSTEPDSSEISEPDSTESAVGSSDDSSTADSSNTDDGKGDNSLFIIICAGIAGVLAILIVIAAIIVKKKKD